MTAKAQKILDMACHPGTPDSEALSAIRKLRSMGPLSFGNGDGDTFWRSAYLKKEDELESEVVNGFKVRTKLSKEIGELREYIAYQETEIAKLHDEIEAANAKLNKPSSDAELGKRFRELLTEANFGTVAHHDTETTESAIERARVGLRDRKRDPIPREVRAIIRALVATHGLKPKEIATALGIAEGSVYNIRDVVAR